MICHWTSCTFDGDDISCTGNDPEVILYQIFWISANGEDHEVIAVAVRSPDMWEAIDTKQYDRLYGFPS